MPDMMELRYGNAVTSPVVAHYACDRPPQFTGYVTSSYFCDSVYVCLQ